MKRNTKSALLLSIASIIVCCAMLIGTTMAWFTDSVTSARNQIIAGNLDIVLEMFVNGEWIDAENEIIPFVAADGRSQEEILWEPGCTYKMAPVRVRNVGNLAAYVVIGIRGIDGDAKLLEAIEFTTYLENLEEVNEKVLEGNDYNADGKSSIKPITGTPDGTVLWDECLTPKDEIAPNNGLNDSTASIILSGHMIEEAGNEYMGLSIKGITITVVGTQTTYEEDSFDRYYDKNAELPKLELPADTWDGTVDTTWYNDTDTEFTIDTAEKLAGLSELVDGGNTFAGKTVKLGADIDLYHLADGATDPTCFDPIGSYRKDLVFEGVLDGQNHTIANMNQNTWALNNGYYYGDLGLGLFGAVENATIKNLIMDNASISGESALCGTVAAVAGANVTFENITVKNSDVADYQYYAGGIVGWAGGDEQFINCVIDASTTIGDQWGGFNNANGGVIGGASTSADILMKNCTVACRIDAFNDVTSAYQWYSYRRSGMLIGDTGQVDDPNGDNVGNAIAPNLTCENVTVIYGDWANYHYCQFTAESYPWVRVEAGTSNGAYSNPRYGNPTDANGNKVVDGNHAHKDGEKHNELIVFDQLYGGESGDRYCTYGTATHTGVTVTYNNK